MESCPSRVLRWTFTLRCDGGEAGAPEGRLCPFKAGKKTSEEAGAEGEAAESAPRSKAVAYGASFVFVPPQNRTRLEESASFFTAAEQTDTQ